MGDLAINVLRRTIGLMVLMPAVLVLFGRGRIGPIFRSMAIAMWVGTMIGASLATILWLLGLLE